MCGVDGERDNARHLLRCDATCLLRRECVKLLHIACDAGGVGCIDWRSLFDLAEEFF